MSVENGLLVVVLLGVSLVAIQRETKFSELKEEIARKKIPDCWVPPKTSIASSLICIPGEDCYIKVKRVEDKVELKDE